MGVGISLRLGTRSPSPSLKVEALRSLVANLRSGAPIRTAIAEWQWGGPEAARPHLSPVARRALLGAPLRDALASCEQLFGADHPALVAAVELHLACGVDAASMLEGLADEIAEREIGSGSARAHAAGARLSARLIGGLPLALVPLMPPAKARLLDPLGLALLLAGLALAAGGIWWLSRLLPEPPGTGDMTVMFAVSLGRCLEAGLDLTTAMDLASRRAATADGDLGGTRGDEVLSQAARWVRLGIPTRDALIRSGHEGLMSVGRCLERAERSGAPPAKELLQLADARRAEIQLAFEEELRRAPVKMVVPLAVCVLPSFALLGLAPFLRGVTLGA